MAERINGIAALGLLSEALVAEFGYIESLTCLKARCGIDNNFSLYLFFNRPTTVTALSMTSTVPVLAFLRPDIIVLVYEVTLMLTIGVGVALHCALSPHQLIAEVHIGATSVVISPFTTKTKQLRASLDITPGRCGVGACELDDVLE